MESGDHSQRLAAYERNNRRLWLGVALALSLAIASLLVQLTSSTRETADTEQVALLAAGADGGVWARFWSADDAD